MSTTNLDWGWTICTLNVAAAIGRHSGVVGMAADGRRYWILPLYYARRLSDPIVQYFLKVAINYAIVVLEVDF